jgi:ABC-type branched-subunit amino acid transport system substrate-binding protein
MMILLFFLLLLLLPQDNRILEAHSVITRPYRSTIFQSVSSNANRSTIRIGAPISYSPHDIHFTKGIQMSNSWDMFVDWVNIERGGVRLNGTNVSMSIQIVEDYSSVDDVKGVTHYLLEEEKVDFMFAPYSSTLTNVSATITENDDFLLFSAVGHPRGSNVNHTVYTIPTDTKRMRSTFYSFVSFGAKNISVISENDHDNCQYENTVKAALAEGINLYSHHTLDNKSPTYLQDITNILLDLKENNVAVVIGCSLSSLCTHVSHPRHLLLQQSL